jgi:hypothetical protein
VGGGLSEISPKKLKDISVLLFGETRRFDPGTFNMDKLKRML